MSREIKWEWPLAVLVALTLLVAIWVYPQLPEQVPMHWNVKGQVDSYGSRFKGAFAIPLLNLALYFLFIYLPQLDPKRENYAKFSEVYRVLRYLIHVFLEVLYVVIILTALGYQVPVGRVIPGAVALLLVIIGNFMGRLRFNYFVGIKTPWTLANEEVWQRTHRLSGYVWTISGLLALLSALLLPQSWIWLVFMPLILGAAFFSLAYSYWLFQKIGR
ncbi:MAG: SdpI family protein [Thermoanaerobacteraceae bacterium]|nr:SdpI family protein [Thermoanaerobacteraceae bacterium]